MRHRVNKSSTGAPGPTGIGRRRSSATSIRQGKVHKNRRPDELVDTGLRLHALRDSDALYSSVIDAAARASGAQRVLLVLNGPDGLRIAGSRVPRGEDTGTLLQAVTPWLSEASRTRTASLRHGPDGAKPIDQRSCVITPLIAEQQLLGCLYADIEGDAGRFDETDRDLLAMLAAHAAVALDNMRRTQGMERAVERRIAERDARAAELALIDSIHRGIAAHLDFQAIVELVGDKLREVFHTGDASIHWLDPKLGLVQRLYTYEHGVRLTLPPFQRKLDDPVDKRLSSQQPLVLNTVAEAIQWGMSAVAGTDQARSIVRVPIYTDDRLLGSIGLKNHEREHAFGEAEVHLLGTVAASMGVALENARLFDETQRLLKETEQRNAELAVINSIQQGMAAEPSSRPSSNSSVTRYARCCGSATSRSCVGTRRRAPRTRSTRTSAACGYRYRRGDRMSTGRCPRRCKRSAR